MNDQPFEFIDHKSNTGDPFMKDFTPRPALDPKAYTVREPANESLGVQNQSELIRPDFHQAIASPPPLRPIELPNTPVASPPPASETNASAAKAKSDPTETSGPASTKKI